MRFNGFIGFNGGAYKAKEATFKGVSKTRGNQINLVTSIK